MRKKISRIKRGLAVMLSVCMVFGVAPIQAGAEENDSEIAVQANDSAGKTEQQSTDEEECKHEGVEITFNSNGFGNCPKCNATVYQPAVETTDKYDIDDDSTKDIVYITGVWIECVNKGVFTVASSDPANVGVHFPTDGERGKLPARDAEGKEIAWTDEEGKSLYPMQVREEDADKEVNQRPATDGGVFLLPPGNNATLLINTVYYPDATGSEPYITTFSYDLKDAVYNKDENGAYLSSGFMGGREYNISAYIYGPQDIKLNVQAASWVNGGDIEIGEE